MEKLSFGFQYDIVHLSPKGDLLDKQRVKNLIPNEGITEFLKVYFLAKGSDKEFVFGFIESEYEPKVTDSVAGKCYDYYESDIANVITGKRYTVTNSDPYNYQCPMMPNIRTMMNDQKGVQFGTAFFKADGKKTLTGVWLSKKNGWAMTGSNMTFSIKNYSVLISVAKFKNPIITTNGSVVKVSAQFKLAAL